MAQALVDLEAVAVNTRMLRRAAGDAGLMAVVKANGYGHGAIEVARTALANGATWLGVATTDEALALRAAGVDAPILAWLYPPDGGLADTLAARINVTASSVHALETIAATAQRHGRVAHVHLEADTGMSRGGASVSEWPQVVSAARELEKRGALRVVGLWSHLAVAEAPDDDGVNQQLRDFGEFRQSALAVGLAPEVVHIANSTAVLRLPESRFTLVRPGLALYGIEPMPGVVYGLRPAMTVSARVLRTTRVPAGTGVSYGWHHVTDRETTLAQVPLGFADGVPRAASGRAVVWVRGHRVPIVGWITMDQIVVDVGDLPVRAGESVTMFGPGDRGEPTALEWAEWADTIPSDILSGIGSRMRRTYLPPERPARLAGEI
ncbi:alanine racemase [Actinoplanes sp. NBRC 103695]|uniref:alanine racemase n=1 Tax=Actinoplanes sp. NBRC 103695 TaxID=3032202 RepID=UPI002554108D|nr:alanine racemase [Actinoplanes sp. NBRC 103695]